MVLGVPRRQGLPGARAHIETPGDQMEQERPIGHHALVGMGAGVRGRTGVPRCKSQMGIGPSHSSDEACEGGEAPTSGWSEGEGRAGNPMEGKMSHTQQRWNPICPELRRVQEKARVRPEERFTSLAHYLTVDRLRRAFEGIDGSAAPGVDGVTKQEYGRNLEHNLDEL